MHFIIGGSPGVKTYRNTRLLHMLRLAERNIDTTFLFSGLCNGWRFIYHRPQSMWSMAAQTPAWSLDSVRWRATRQTAGTALPIATPQPACCTMLTSLIW